MRQLDSTCTRPHRVPQVLAVLGAAAREAHGEPVVGDVVHVVARAQGLEQQLRGGAEEVVLKVRVQRVRFRRGVAATSLPI
jgi:hypothetical protein